MTKRAGRGTSESAGEGTGQNGMNGFGLSAIKPVALRRRHARQRKAWQVQEISVDPGKALEKLAEGRRPVDSVDGAEGHQNLQKAEYGLDFWAVLSTADSKSRTSKLLPVEGESGSEGRELGYVASCYMQLRTVCRKDTYSIFLAG